MSIFNGPLASYLLQQHEFDAAATIRAITSEPRLPIHPYLAYGVLDQVAHNVQNAR
jgi:hypothetical protein